MRLPKKWPSFCWLRQQLLPAARHDLRVRIVLAALRRVAGALKREQRHRGRGFFVFNARAALDTVRACSTCRAIFCCRTSQRRPSFTASSVSAVPPYAFSSAFFTPSSRPENSRPIAGVATVPTGMRAVVAVGSKHRRTDERILHFRQVAAGEAPRPRLSTAPSPRSKTSTDGSSSCSPSVSA